MGWRPPPPGSPPSHPRDGHTSGPRRRALGSISGSHTRKLLTVRGGSSLVRMDITGLSGETSRETSEGLTPLNIARDLKLPQTQTPTKTQAPDRQPVPSGPLPSWDLGCSRPPRAAERRVLSAEPATSRRQLPRRPPTQRLVQTDRHPEPLAAPRRAPGAAAGKASAAGYLQGDCFERGAL